MLSTSAFISGAFRYRYSFPNTYAYPGGFVFLRSCSTLATSHRRRAPPRRPLTLSDPAATAARPRRAGRGAHVVDVRQGFMPQRVHQNLRPNPASARASPPPPPPREIHRDRVTPTPAHARRARVQGAGQSDLAGDGEGLVALHVGEERRENCEHQNTPRPPRVRRVRLVREEGRDVSSQYGREGGAPTWDTPLHLLLRPVLRPRAPAPVVGTPRHAGVCAWWCGVGRGAPPPPECTVGTWVGATVGRLGWGGAGFFLSAEEPPPPRAPHPYSCPYPCP